MASKSQKDGISIAGRIALRERYSQVLVLPVKSKDQAKELAADPRH